MHTNLIDCLPEAFYMLFGGNVPDEINPREVKDMRTILNRVAEKKVGHQFPKNVLRETIDAYIIFRGYKKKFIRNYQELNEHQWVYRLR